MNIGVSRLVGHLVDAEPGLDGGGAVKMPEDMRGDSIGVVLTDPVDLFPAQSPSTAADKQIRAACVGAFQKILSHRIHHFIANEHNPRLPALSAADGNLLGRQGHILRTEGQALTDP